MFSYNIILIGDSGVGKSTFFIQFFNHTFQEKSVATIGIEYHKTEMNVEGVPVIIHIYDTRNLQAEVTHVERISNSQQVLNSL